MEKFSQETLTNFSGVSQETLTKKLLFIRMPSTPLGEELHEEMERCRFNAVWVNSRKVTELEV